MRGLIHDLLRSAIGRCLVLLGALLTLHHQRKIRRFSRVQARLRSRYGVLAETPIRELDPVLQARLEARSGPGLRIAETSGTTSRPKQIAYSRSRLRQAALVFIDAFARAYAAIPLRRHSLYVFSPVGTASDTSLTALLLEERDLPPYLSGLQAPYRVHGHPAMRALADEHGSAAVRVFVLALSNPGVLYATNPSTLCAFLDELRSDWPRARSLVRAWVSTPAAFDPAIHRVARRLDSRGAAARLSRIAASETPLPLSELAPAVEAYACWTGGHLAPFLERLASILPPDRHRCIPMYSMSTETIETVPHFEGGEVSFLPLAPGIFYELLPEEAPDDPALLLPVSRAESGRTYTLVVSDRWGLLRYQTGDVFECRGFIHGLPDLRFLRRRGLSYSFTGEKLTAEHVSSALEVVRAAGSLAADTFASLIPSWPPGAVRPHYKLALVAGMEPIDTAAIGRAFDQALGAANGEYAQKRASRRLDPVSVLLLDTAALAHRLGGDRQRDTWEAQLKFLPLSTKTWESSEPRGTASATP